MADQPGDAAAVNEFGVDLTTVQAVEATVEGVPSALSLAPGSVVPALGGELALSPEPQEADALVSTDSVREGLRQAGPLAIAGLAANGANVIVTILMARLLTTRGYGALAQLTGIFLIVSMPGSAVIVGVVRHVTAWKGQGSAVRIWRWARRLHFKASLAAVLFVVVMVFARVPLARALSLPDAVGILGVLGAGALWVLLSLDRGLLQAHRDYRTLSVNLLVEGGMRTVAMLGLVAAGLGVAGAAWGMFIAELVTAIHARVVADRAWSAEAAAESSRPATSDGSHSAAVPVGERAGDSASMGTEALGSGPGVQASDQERPDEPGLMGSGPAGATEGAASGWWAKVMELVRPDPSLQTPSAHRRLLLADLVAALAAMALLALLQNIDVIVLGKEAPHSSGGYAAVSVASKALVFGAIALGGYLLPEAAIRWRQGGHALRQLLVTMVLLAIPALALLVVSVLFPHLLLSIVFSNRYLSAQDAFVWLVLAMVCLSTTVVLTMYLLAIGRRWIGGVLAAGAVAATAGVVAAHGAPRTTAQVDLAVQAVLAAVTTTLFLVVHKQRLRPVV